MNYQPIDRANVADAARHLEEARRTKDSEKILIAAQVLRERLLLIKDSNPQLYKEFFHLLDGGYQ